MQDEISSVIVKKKGIPPMRITVLSLGSRGDVQPFIALAAGLQKAGRYTVRLAAPDNFEPLAKAYNLNFSPLGVDTEKLLGAGGIVPDRNVLLWLRDVLRSMRPLLDQVAENTRLASSGTRITR